MELQLQNLTKQYGEKCQQCKCQSETWSIWSAWCKWCGKNNIDANDMWCSETDLRQYQSERKND